MPIQVHTSLLAGGLDLVTPPIAMPPGKAIAAVNYEPDVSGYTSMSGYERFDGRPAPSDTTDPAAQISRRNSIVAVPGSGPVRGVWVYDGDVYAFRDQSTGLAGMFKATQGGWAAQTFGIRIAFSAADGEFIEGEFVIGATSSAQAVVERVILRSGAWDGTGEGYLIVSNTVGTFSEEVINGTTSTATAAGGGELDITVQAGGRYSFTNHNFYGAADRANMYFANGVGTAFEWNGSVLSPIYTGTTAGELVSATYLISSEATLSVPIVSSALSGSARIITSATYDAPTYVAQFKNHLWLGYSSGSLLFSSLGNPLQYITTTGAGEIAFGDQITGLLTAAATSLMVFAQNRIEYITGDDASSFVMNPVSATSGAKSYTAQMMDSPMFMDDGGLRSLPTTAAFGDWRMASVTQSVEPLMRKKLKAGVHPVASMRIRAKDQYRLFWADGTGITTYIGRKAPDTLPFKIPILIYSACSGEVEVGHGDRLFVGCEDGYVYEMNRGTSFDGAAIDAYIRLPFNAAGSPQQDTRWTKATFEMSTPNDITVGVAFDVDYARGLGAGQVDIEVDAGAAIITAEHYANVDWTQPVQGRLEFHLSGLGPNIAATLITSSAVAEPHTFSSQTYNFSRRGLKR